MHLKFFAPADAGIFFRVFLRCARPPTRVFDKCFLNLFEILLSSHLASLPGPPPPLADEAINLPSEKLGKLIVSSARGGGGPGREARRGRRGRKRLPIFSRFCPCTNSTRKTVRTRPYFANTDRIDRPRVHYSPVQFTVADIEVRETSTSPASADTSAYRAYLPDDVVAPVAACSTLFGQSGLLDVRI